MPKVLEEDPSKTMKIEGIDLYNVSQLSKLLKTTKHTIRKYFRDGKFPPLKIRGNYYLAKDNLSKYIKEGKIKMPSPEIPFYHFDENLSFREMKNMDNNIIEATENKLKIIEKVIEKNREIVKFIKNPIAKIILGSYIKRYDKLKKEVEEFRKNPLSPDDM
jgi:DNA-binding transcriptional MerR regulator